VIVRNGYMCIRPKPGLEAESWRWSSGSDRTHVKHVKNPVKLQPPGGDRLIIVYVEKSGDHTPFAPLDDFPLDLGQGPVIESVVNRSPGVCTAGSTHVVSCSIALRTDLLS